MGVIQTFGCRVRYFRKIKKISQGELASHCGLHRTYIGSIERGERNITLKNAARIAQALQEPLTSFLEEPIMTIETKLDAVLNYYQEAFSRKEFSDNDRQSDVLMKAFGITPEMKKGNPQYWGRELGKCWEKLVIEACQDLDSFQPALKIGTEEPCDLRLGKYAIDTKYRVGSGDSGTLKKFKDNGQLLRDNGYEPVVLILREDNLDSAINAFRSGDWKIYLGRDSFGFIKGIIGFDLENYLVRKERAFLVDR